METLSRLHSGNSGSIMSKLSLSTHLYHSTIVSTHK